MGTQTGIDLQKVHLFGLFKEENNKHSSNCKNFISLEFLCEFVFSFYFYRITLVSFLSSYFILSVSNKIF